MSEGTEIGLRIKEARIKAGLNRSGLAKLAGMSLAYVSLLEAGNIPAPTVDRLSRIAGALDTPLERIISESEYSPAQRSEQHTGLIDELISMAAPNAEPEMVRAFVAGLLHLSREDQIQVAELISRLKDRQEGGHTS